MDAQAQRIFRAVTAVLPAGASASVHSVNRPITTLRIGETPVTAAWVGEGWLGDVKTVITHHRDELDLIVARRISPGAAAAAAQAGLGWIDEAGGAEVTLPGLVLARTARHDPPPAPEPRWTPSVLGTAEALLVGVQPTVSAVHQHTRLSTGAAANALKTLTTWGYLHASSSRGRNSARHIVDPEKLLLDYATAASTQPRRPRLRVGVVGDLMDELSTLGRTWDRSRIGWALTGIAGAALLAPYLAEVTSAEVFVDATTPAELEALARRAGLPVLDGGRVTLRPFPTAVSDHLSTVVDGMHVAPWPRVFADLRVTGVRGEEAAEHLKEVMTGD